MDGRMDDIGWMYVSSSLFLPAGSVCPAPGRLVMQPVFVQTVMVKLYKWNGFSPSTT